MDEKQLQAVPTQPEESALPEDAQHAMKHAQPASPSADEPAEPETHSDSDEVSSEATEAEETGTAHEPGDAPAPPEAESQPDGTAPSENEASPDADEARYNDEPVAINVAEELAGDPGPDEASTSASPEPPSAASAEPNEDAPAQAAETQYVDEPVAINVAEELADEEPGSEGDERSAVESSVDPSAGTESDTALEEPSDEDEVAVGATEEDSDAPGPEVEEPAPDAEPPVEEPEEEDPAPPVNDPSDEPASDDPVPADDPAPMDDPVNDEPVSINVAEEMAEESTPSDSTGDDDANSEPTDEGVEAETSGTDVLTETLDSAAEAGALLGVTESMGADELLGEQEQPIDAAEARQKQLKAVLEAIVYVLNDPMPAAQIAQALNEPLAEVEPILRLLVEETAQADRGVFIREVAGGYQMATKPEHHDVIRQFVKNLKQPLKLSQAALETLAVIAYKQPITLPEILEIRGVQGGGVLKTLLDRKLVTTAGRKNVIGKPMLYKTTKEFLTQFGLRDTAELPSLKEFEEIRRQSMADDEIVAEETEMPEAMREAEAAERAALQESEAQAEAEASSEPNPEESPVTEAQAPAAAEQPEETPAEGSEETEPNHG